MSIDKKLKVISTLIQFTRNPQIKGDLIIAKEYLELAKFFETASEELVDKNKNEIKFLIDMVKRAT